LAIEQASAGSGSAADGDLHDRQERIAAAVDATDGDRRFDRITLADRDWFWQHGPLPRLLGRAAAQGGMRTVMVVPMPERFDAALNGTAKSAKGTRRKR